ncbi:polysaccharide biosynthesis/export family protein [Fulvivirgaceae bacterium BMA12]|uniref:Polysaccharide biosynthesis/export family protein n=1 Tax=Agaribacillus aureus TaxID=3051825 RepID=A0ABT8L172_9BACT|nr:polysaccharide biosynthesis/export family protein [Fulvivirgaceae bacterium BMA12]
MELDYQTKYVEYRLKSEDILQIKVFTTTVAEFNWFAQAQVQLEGGGDPLLSGFTIDDQGNIELPVIGNVKINGLTINEAQKKISSLLQQGGLESPKVVIKILSFQYTVLGEINNPGVFNNYTGKINILEALAQAGDFTDFADRKNIKIVRYENNIARVLYVNVLDRDILSNPYFYIQPNDHVIVDPLKAVNGRTSQQNIAISVSLLASIASIALLVDRLLNE